MQYLIIILNSQESTRIPHLDRIQPASMCEGPVGCTSNCTQLTQPDSTISRSLKMDACINLLHAFLFLFHHNCIVNASHPLESRAVTAAKILLADAKDTGCRAMLPLLDEVYSVFVDMQNSHASRNAISAVEYIHRTRTELDSRSIANESGSLSRDAIHGRPSPRSEHHSCKSSSAPDH